MSSDPLVTETVFDPITIEARHPITGVLAAELPYTKASWSDALSSPGSYDVTLPLDDLESVALVEPNATAIYFVRSGRALFGGLVDRRSVDTKTRTVRIAGKGFLDYLNRRVILGRNGMTYADTAGTTMAIGWTAKDQFRIVKDVIDHLALYPGDLGFTSVLFNGGATLSGITRSKETFYGTERKKAGALINEFAKLDDGFDISVSHPAYDPVTGPTRVLELSYPRRGRTIDTVLEHGRNVVVLTDETDAARQGNPFTAVGAGSGDAIKTVEAIDTSLLAPVGRYLRQDGEVSAKDVADTALLTFRAAAGLAAFKAPIQTIDVEVIEALDLAVGSMVPGDSLTVIVDDAALTVDDVYRITKIAPTLTPEGWVTVKLSLANAAASLGDA